MATLQELDAWGNLESLDIYGNLEALDALAIRTAESSVSTAITTTSSTSIVLVFSGNVTGATSIAAQAAFIAHMTASGSLVITSTAEPKRLQHYTASAAFTASSTGDAVAVQHVDANVDVSSVATSGTSVTFVMLGAETFEVAAEAIGEIMGEKWILVADGTETWSDVSVGSETWTETEDGTETWVDVAAGAEVWVKSTDGTETWYRQ